ncbi:hypothetical protein [Nitrospina watsonii]|uniref:Uncharacterized protein n=1 Tax=Nitrospina watsonii TaxID=1323948 RepID=A0ABN8VUN8_9BACT|nr:hypothetical protein [Nitrospina watsonii]CAI2717530.1 protein of unknown function [Nitrospina watsonii]
MTTIILSGINRGTATIVSKTYFTSFRQKIGVALISGMLAFTSFYLTWVEPTFAEAGNGVEVEGHTPPQLVSFAEYSKMTQDEKREIFKNTIIDLYIKLRQKGQESRAQCLKDAFGNSNESILKLIATLEAKAELEEEDQKTRYKKPVPWHIARRMLEICPSTPTPVVR